MAEPTTTEPITVTVVVEPDARRPRTDRRYVGPLGPFSCGRCCHLL